MVELRGLSAPSSILRTVCLDIFERRWLRVTLEKACLYARRLLLAVDRTVSYALVTLGFVSNLYKRKNRRASRALFFLIGLRQVKVVDCIHGNNCIRHGIASGGRRFRPRLVRAVEV